MGMLRMMSGDDFGTMIEDGVTVTHHDVGWWDVKVIRQQDIL
jgi:hypothetical protein